MILNWRSLLQLILLVPWITTSRCVASDVTQESALVGGRGGDENERSAPLHTSSLHSIPDDMDFQRALKKLSIPLNQEEMDVRSLETTPCNTEIATFTAEQVRTMTQAFIGSLDLSLIEEYALNAIIVTKIKYGILMKTVCASCDSAVAAASDPILEDDSNYEDFNRYCGDGVYGKDIEHSGLVLLPLEEDSNGDWVQLSGTLPSLIYSRPSRTNKYNIPSQNFNGAVGEDTILGIVATSTRGVMTLGPDFNGYGLSSAFRSYLIRDQYVTSALPLWMKVRTDLSQSTNCSTALADAAFFVGYSEGGYASVALAEGFKTALGVTPIAVRSGGAPFAMGTATLMKVIANLDADLLPQEFYYIGVLLGSAYSSTNEYAANYGQGQDLLEARYMDPTDTELYVTGWLEEPTIDKTVVTSRLLELLVDSPEGTSASQILWNQTYVNFLRDAVQNNITDLCSLSSPLYEVGVNDKFCDALLQNDLIDVLLQADYPIDICHSVNDYLVTFDNVPDVSLNPNLSLSTKTAPHTEAGFECQTDNVLYLVSVAVQNFIPEDKHSDSGSCSPPPEPTCIDSPFLFKTFKKVANDGTKKYWFKDCEYIKTEAPARCEKNKQVRILCPQTCDVPCICEDTSGKFKMMVNGKLKNKTCNWAVKKNKCNKPGVKDVCRKSCGSC